MVILATCILTTTAIRFYVFGIFLVPMTKEFNWDRGELSVAPSITWVIAGLLSLITGRLSDKYGPRILVTINGLLTVTAFLLMSMVSSLWQVYLVWGLLMGIGGACLYIPIISSIPRWFARKRGTAIGITYASFGLGAIFAPPLSQWLIDSYSWQHAFIIIGLMQLIIVIPLAQYLKHSPEKMGIAPYGETEIKENEILPSPIKAEFSLKKVIKTSRFWLFSSILFCFFFCLQIILIHIAPYAIDIGLPPIIAASTLSIIGGSSIIGRLTIGPISDRMGGRKAITACLVLVLLSLVWLLFAREIWMFCLFAVMFGLAYGGIVPMETVVTTELFGLGSLGMILASLELFPALGASTGAPIAGGIFDATGTYLLAFLMCIALCIIAIILSLFLLRFRIKESQLPVNQ